MFFSSYRLLTLFLFTSIFCAEPDRTYTTTSLPSASLEFPPSLETPTTSSPSTQALYCHSLLDCKSCTAQPDCRWCSGVCWSFQNSSCTSSCPTSYADSDSFKLGFMVVACVMVTVVAICMFTIYFKRRQREELHINLENQSDEETFQLLLRAVAAIGEHSSRAAPPPYHYISTEVHEKPPGYDTVMKDPSFVNREANNTEEPISGD